LAIAVPFHIIKYQIIFNMHDFTSIPQIQG